MYAFRVPEDRARRLGAGAAVAALATSALLVVGPPSAHAGQTQISNGVVAAGAIAIIGRKTLDDANVSSVYGNTDCVWAQTAASADTFVADADFVRESQADLANIGGGPGVPFDGMMAGHPACGPGYSSHNYDGSWKRATNFKSGVQYQDSMVGYADW